MSVKRFQARMGYALIAVFAVGLVMVNARAPEPVEMNETVLGNIVRDSQTEFKAGFGGFPNLVPDRGGEPPQPLAAVTSQRGAHYRSEAWLLAQPITGHTIQLGVFSTERAATAFIRDHGGANDLRYFELLEMPDPAMGLVTSAPSRFVVSFGEFENSDEAVGVASILTGYGNQFLVRSWQSYQLTLSSVKAVLARNLLARQVADEAQRAAAEASADVLSNQPSAFEDPAQVP